MNTRELQNCKDTIELLEGIEAKLSPGPHVKATILWLREKIDAHYVAVREAEDTLVDHNCAGPCDCDDCIAARMFIEESKR